MKRMDVLIGLIIVASLLAACGPTEPQVVEKEVTKVVTEQIVETVVVESTPQVVEREVTTVVEKLITATPEPTVGPAMGGTVVYALEADIDSLDAHQTRDLTPCQYYGGSLIARHPESGEFVPYLAESWTMSEDGLTYEFKLRPDVKFHDGTPMTAHDYAWTFNRAKDPATKAGAAGTILANLDFAEAVDDYTLRLNMKAPDNQFLFSLSDACFAQPLSQAYVEEMGEDYARHPLGVGPFKFKEWVTGEKLVLERNPDFGWAPEYAHPTPPYVETVEFHILPEYATRLLGLESGDVDYADLAPKDVERIQSTGQFQIFAGLDSGTGDFLFLNTTKPPFDDLRVRQAFSLAVNRDALVKVALQGHAVPIYGPLTPATIGYWPGVEYIGFKHNLDKTKALMSEAGYTLGSDNVWEKNGQPLELVLKTYDEISTKMAQVLQQQFKEMGAAVEIEQLEACVLTSQLRAGDYVMATYLYGWPNYGILFASFRSSMIGVFNHSRVNDPELDALIDAMVGELDPERQQQATNDVQRRIVEQAYTIPLLAQKQYSALSDRVKGALYSEATQDLELFNIYIETGGQ